MWSIDRGRYTFYTYFSFTEVMNDEKRNSFFHVIQLAATQQYLYESV